MRPILRAVSIILAMAVAGSVYASGGGGGFGGGGFGGFGGAGSAPQRVVDENYEYGKAIYLGREPGTEKVAYCVMVEGEPKKLKRSTLKEFKGGAVNAFAQSLLNCEMPEQLALETVKEEQVPFVIYYLNKRYKLKLGNS